MNWALRAVACGMILLLWGAPLAGQEAAPAAPPPAASAPAALTQADLLRRTIDFARLVTPPQPGERVLLFSTPADAASLVRDSAGFVLASAAGPGVLTRIACPQPRGALRVVLDGSTIFDAPLVDLLAGRIPPLEPPLVCGNTCTYPIGFRQECQVLWHAADGEAADPPPLCEVEVLRLPNGVGVQTFTRASDADAAQALAEIREAAATGLSDRQILGGRRAPPVVVQESIGPDESIVQRVEGAGTVRALYVALTDAGAPELHALHECVLRVFVDGQKTPHVEAPLSAFFGCGFEPAALLALPIGTARPAPIPLPNRPLNEAYMYCFLPMPFAEGLRVELRNLGASRRKLGLLLDLRVDRSPPAADALRLFARFQRAASVASPARVLEVTGAGRFVGCVYTVDAPTLLDWAAVRETLTLDGRETPAGAALLPLAYADAARPSLCPFQGVTRSAPYGPVSTYRWRVVDAVAFQRALRVGLALPPVPHATYFGAVAYWYAPAGAAAGAPFETLTRAHLSVPPLRIPGAVEIEGFVQGKADDGKAAGGGWGRIVRQRSFSGAEFSADQAAHISTAKPVEILLPAPAAGRYRLQLRVSTARTFETIAVRDAAGKPLGNLTFDARPDGLYDVGVVDLIAGDNRLVVQCTRQALLDCWVLAPAQAVSQPAE